LVSRTSCGSTRRRSGQPRAPKYAIRPSLSGRPPIFRAEPSEGWALRPPAEGVGTLDTTRATLSDVRDWARVRAALRAGSAPERDRGRFEGSVKRSQRAQPDRHKTLRQIMSAREEAPSQRPSVLERFPHSRRYPCDTLARILRSKMGVFRPHEQR
jgi:hypothetical protein